MNGFMYGGSHYGWMGSGGLMSVASVFMVWSLFWKGLALWHAGQRKQGWWFIALLLINTVGILEIIYLFAVLKLKPDQLIPKK